MLRRSHHNLVPFNRFKFEQCWATLCLHRGLSGIAVSDWRIAIFRDSPPRCIKGFEKSGIDDGLDDLDAAHRANIMALLNQANKIIEQQAVELDRLAEMLITRADFSL